MLFRSEVKYGEGRQAFYRLQEEILRSGLWNFDMTLFAWGHQFNALELEDLVSVQGDKASVPPAGYLLAPSSDEFRNTTGAVMLQVGVHFHRLLEKMLMGFTGKLEVPIG